MLKFNLKIFSQSISIFLLANIPIIIVSNYIFLNRALFNLDYVFGLLLAPFNILLSFFLLFIIFLLDVLISGYFLFDFIDLIDLFYSLSFLREVDFLSIINFTVLLLIILFCSIFFFTVKFTNKKKLKHLILIVFLLFIIDFTNSTNVLSVNSRVKFNINISGSNFLNIVHYIINKINLK